MKWIDIDNGVVDHRRPRSARKATPAHWCCPTWRCDIIEAQPHLGDNPYVFAGRGDGHMSGYSKAKKLFDAKLPDIEPWVIHDLRRTARSLLSRAGVSSEHAERVMGHVAQGVEAVYDRHQYRDEKADALKKLSALIQTILHPRRGNVTPIKRAIS